MYVKIINKINQLYNYKNKDKNIYISEFNQIYRNTRKYA